MAKAQPPVKVTERKISEFTQDPSNANQGTERGLRVLDDSIAETGLGRSVVVDKNDILIAGNKTTERAVDRGFVDAIVVETTGDKLVIVKRTDLDLLTDDPNNPARKLAYYDNRAGEVGLSWDAEQLLADINAGVDLSHLFTDGELDALLAGLQTGEVGDDPGAQIDRAEELQAKWNVARGDLWLIGEHRLLCGDSTHAEDVARLMGGEKADSVIADPPYGMNLDASYQNSLENFDRGIKRSKGYSQVIGDEQEFDPRPYFANHDAINEQFWFGADYYRQYLPTGGSWLVWDKRDGLPEFDYTLSEFELCWSKAHHMRKVYGVRWFGAFGTETQDTKRRVHPTQKPVQLIAALIELAHGQIIYDPFLGSGTTLVACEQTGRKGRGLEISEKYCAVILERMAGMGLSPRLSE